MKKSILLVVILLVIFSSIVNALPDLIVKDFKFNQEPIYGAELDYTVYIQNIGDTEAITTLPISIRTSTAPEDMGRFMITYTGEDRIGPAPIKQIMIKKIDGTIRYEKPIERILTIQGLEGSELEKAVSEKEKELRNPSSIEEIKLENKKLGIEEDIEIMIQKELFDYRESISQDSQTQLYTIILKPGEIAIWNSEDTKHYVIRFFPKEHYLEGTAGYVEIKIDPGGIIESNKENNVLHKEVWIKGSIIQGPSTGIKNVPNLIENEYFVMGQGCTADLRGRKICFGDDNKGNYIFSVDGEELIVSKYNKIYKLFVRLVMRGKESPSVKIKNIELSAYHYGFKIKFM